MVKRTKESMDAENRYYAAGHKVPICANIGCTRPVAVRDWKYWSFKTECTTCSTARKNNTLIAGITSIKKRSCENHDGHLGFSCPVDHQRWPDFQDSLDIDHLDGDHGNNKVENLKTYCKLCHNRKSRLTKDWHSNKSSGRKF